MAEKKTLNIKKTTVGDRKIFYTEVLLIKKNKLLVSIAKFKSQKKARQDIRKKMQKKYGNAKYKIKKLFLLPPEFEIEEIN